MQYVDQYTDPGRLNDRVRPLLRAMLANQQIRQADADDPAVLTDAVKYERRPQNRRQTSPYRGNDAFVESIIDIFGFDPLEFQVDSWQTIDRLDQQRVMDSEPKAAVLSAPTGFGKTEAFLGPVYQLLREDRQDAVAIVYPSTALLQDQLKRVLKHIHKIKTETGEQLSVGCYIGNMPWDRADIGNTRFFQSSGTGRPRLQLCNCWCGDETSHSFELHGEPERSYTIECEHDSSHRFTDREFVAARKDLVFNNPPDIVLTTLQSLENFAHKPHYPLTDLFDTIILDEAHLHTGLQGAHAAKIIQNVNDISDDPLLWLGSSATIDDPERFGQQLFGVSSENIETTEPPSSDFDRNHDDYEHYYFMLASKEGSGVTSLAIQQSMLLGHTMLERSDGWRSKQLSFIDSISQINQQSTQFVDADTEDELWQYHRNGQHGEDWDSVAREMGHQFIDEPLDVTRVSAEHGFDRDEVARGDILMSSSFLEVGIDVGEINIITQHRTPWSLSAFLQRAGRAAREPGMDSHIAVYLSNLTGDANMFYRADRFLGSDIRTPINTQNRVVEWMHERFNRYYTVCEEIDGEHFRSKLEEHETFLDRYLVDELEYGAYHTLVMDPSTFVSEHLGLDVSPDRLLGTPQVENLQEKLEAYREDRREDIAEIEAYFDMEDGNIVRGGDAVETFVNEVQEQTLRVINTFDGQVAGFASKLEETDTASHCDVIEDLNEQLAAVRERALTVPDGDTQEQVAHFSSLQAELFGLTGSLMKLRNEANRATDESVPQVRQDRLAGLSDIVSQLETLSEDNRLKEYYELEEQIHYLKSALDEYKSYLDGPGDPYNSLYGIKDLLRGAYYLDRFLRIGDDDIGERVWFVPPNYFGSAGQFVNIVYEGRAADGSAESIDQIVGTYAPYRSEYQSESGKMQAFLPKTHVTEDGVEMDYTNHVNGERRGGILVPDTLQLSEMQDLTGNSAHEIVQYCPECYQIISDDLDGCLRHDAREYGKIHSEPHADTSVTDRTPIDRAGALTLADVRATVTLDSVTLEITPGAYYGPNIGVGFDSDGERFTQQIDSPDTPLGFVTRTRGLVYELDAFVEGLDDEIREYVGRYRDVDDHDIETVAYHTAAHFFLQLVTDVASVSTQRVFYGYDHDEGEVYVFERTEGGQGIVDLVYDELESDPGSVLESMNRIMYNEQVIAERLWATPSFVQSVPRSDVRPGDVRPLVADAIGVPFDSVVDRVTDEIIATVDRATQFADDEGIEVADAYLLKHEIAKEQIGGVDEFPADVVADSSVDIEETDRVEHAFYSPDIDGCVENLHLTECIEAGDQSDTLSYVILEALRDHLTDSVPVDEAADKLFEHELPPGGETGGRSVFLDF